jgi:hypothetical protein
LFGTSMSAHLILDEKENPRVRLFDVEKGT